MSRRQSPKPKFISPIQVYVRVRPQTQLESKHDLQQVIQVKGNQVILKAPDTMMYIPVTKQYEFKDVFDTEATNEDLHDRVISDQIYTFISGQSTNTTIMAYGQTGSGKTHTIFGSDYDGLVYHIVQQLLEHNQKFMLSYLEIYNERIRDLFSNTPDGICKNVPQMIDRGKEDVAVTGLQWLEISNINDARLCISKGQQRRSTSETLYNQQSSRSHGVIQIELISNGAKLMVIDLAGSEKYSINSKKSSVTQSEGSNINKSLLALANCIKILSSDGKAKLSHVPFRDSKLTRLLKSSLIGTFSTHLIACISPTQITYEETINTLGYAQRAGMIKTTITTRDHISPERLSQMFKHKYSSQTQAMNLYTHEEQQYFTPKKRQDNEKNFLELNKNMERYQSRSKSPVPKRTPTSQRSQNVKQRIQSSPVRIKSAFEKTMNEISCIQQKYEDIESSVRDLLEFMNEKISLKNQLTTDVSELSSIPQLNVRRSTLNSEQSQELSRIRCAQLKSLSQERDNYKEFKRELLTVNEILQSVNVSKMVPEKKVYLSKKVKHLIQLHKKHRWRLMPYELNLLKKAENFSIIHGKKYFY